MGREITHIAIERVGQTTGTRQEKTPDPSIEHRRQIGVEMGHMMCILSRPLSTEMRIARKL